jgi:hypothetical protein
MSRVAAFWIDRKLMNANGGQYNEHVSLPRSIWHITKAPTSEWITDADEVFFVTIT